MKALSLAESALSSNSQMHWEQTKARSLHHTLEVKEELALSWADKTHKKKHFSRTLQLA